MINAIIIAIILVFVILGIKESQKHFRGEGGCCGGASAKPAKKRLRNKVKHIYVLRVDGMHCQNCVNAVTRIINDYEGASGKVSLRKGQASIRCDRDIDIEKMVEDIQKRGYGVCLIKEKEIYR